MTMTLPNQNVTKSITIVDPQANSGGTVNGTYYYCNNGVCTAIPPGQNAPNLVTVYETLSQCELSGCSSSGPGGDPNEQLP